MMFFNPRKPNLGSKRLKKFGILARRAPERAFLAIFDDFWCFLAYEYSFQPKNNLSVFQLELESNMRFFDPRNPYLGSK